MLEGNIDEPNAVNKKILWRTRACTRNRPIDSLSLSLCSSRSPPRCIPLRTCDRVTVTQLLPVLATRYTCAGLQLCTGAAPFMSHLYTLLYIHPCLFRRVPPTCIRLLLSRVCASHGAAARTRASTVQTLRPFQRLLRWDQPCILALHFLINYRALSRCSGPALSSGARNSRVADELTGAT